MNKTELIDKLLHLGSTIEICNSSKTSKKAKELAHNLLDNYLAAINYTHCCTELKDKKALSFDEWLKQNYIHYDKGLFARKAEGSKDLEQLKQIYNKEILNL